MYLARYFLSVRKSDGTEYEPDTLRGHLGSFNRHLRDKRYPINIMESEIFSHAREVLMSKRKNLKSQGLGNSKRKAQPLEDDDIQVLREKNILGSSNARALINTVYLNNSMHFGLRGRNEHEQMLWGDVELKHDGSGLEYLEFTERATKTRTGESSDSRPFLPKMFAKQDDPMCPVQIYKKYTNIQERRRPEETKTPDSRFYLSIITNIGNNEIWFKKQPMGKNTLGSLVKEMAKAGGLDDKKLTNHSARKTTVTKLLDAGFQPTEVMQLTGHKNVQSINNYSMLSVKKQKQMSCALSSSSSSELQVNSPVMDSALELQLLLNILMKLSKAWKKKCQTRE